MRQDFAVCNSIMDMSTFAEFSQMEFTAGSSLSEEQRRWLIMMEKDAGVI